MVIVCLDLSCVFRNENSSRSKTGFSLVREIFGEFRGAKCSIPILYFNSENNFVLKFCDAFLRL